MIGFSALLQAAEVKHIIDKAGQALAFRDNHLQVTPHFFSVLDPAFFQEFRIHADTGQGCFQFMGNT